MPTIKIELEQDAYERLVERAEAERRPIDWQAEVMLRRAVKLPATAPRRLPDPRGPRPAA